MSRSIAANSSLISATDVEVTLTIRHGPVTGPVAVIRLRCTGLSMMSVHHLRPCYLFIFSFSLGVVKAETQTQYRLFYTVLLGFSSELIKSVFKLRASVLRLSIVARGDMVPVSGPVCPSALPMPLQALDILLVRRKRASLQQ